MKAVIQVEIIWPDTGQHFILCATETNKQLRWRIKQFCCTYIMCQHPTDNQGAQSAFFLRCTRLWKEDGKVHVLSHMKPGNYLREKHQMRSQPDHILVENPIGKFWSKCSDLRLKMGSAHNEKPDLGIWKYGLVLYQPSGGRAGSQKLDELPLKHWQHEIQIPGRNHYVVSEDWHALEEQVESWKRGQMDPDWQGQTLESNVQHIIKNFLLWGLDTLFWGPVREPFPIG